MEAIQDDDKAVAAYGIHLGTEMCKKILAHGIKHLHMYTLNLEKSAVGILEVCGDLHRTVILLDCLSHYYYVTAAYYKFGIVNYYFLFRYHVNSYLVRCYFWNKVEVEVKSIW